jgi:hypothetical protein
MSNPVKTYILGTAIKITAVLNIAEVTSAKVSICDSDGNTVLEPTDMTQEVNNIYSYVYQSSESGTSEGKHTIKIEATYAGYTSIVEDCFTLIESECN